MTISIVFDVAAESGGALSILTQYHSNALLDPDKSKTWYFVVSVPELKETDSVRVLRFPWIKKSWIHRLFFDFLIAPRIVERCRADEVLSLQNLIIPRISVPQTLYLHQALPFANFRIGLCEGVKMWAYQHILGRAIIRSVRRADRVIVQTDWMKQACVKKAGISREKIAVTPPVFEPGECRFVANRESLRLFFYPAAGSKYKNHKVIVEAIRLLGTLGITDLSVVFTLTGNENRFTRAIHRQVLECGLPIEFIGPITREEVFEYYKKAVLLFPSRLETLGLPMLEARAHDTPVIAADMPFSREVLDGYDRALFFVWNDSAALAKLVVAVRTLL